MTGTHTALIEKINRIQPLNPIMMELLAAIQNQDSQATDLEHIIRSDANTSATILKIANSPFYGMSGRIKNVRDACVLLGFDQLRNIIYATALEHASNGGPHQIWRQKLRRHTLATAIIASELSLYMTVRIEKGQAYSLGLLHELGKQILVSELPDLFHEYMNTQGQPEQESIVGTLIEAGTIIAQKWRLPEVFQTCIRFALSPDDPPEAFQNEVTLIRCAHQLAQELGFDSPGDRYKPSEPGALLHHYPTLPADVITEKIQDCINSCPDLDRSTEEAQS